VVWFAGTGLSIIIRFGFDKIGYCCLPHKLVRVVKLERGHLGVHFTHSAVHFHKCSNFSIFYTEYLYVSEISPVLYSSSQLWSRSAMLGSAESEKVSRELIFQEFEPIWPRYLNVTDGQTDRQTDGQLAFAPSRGNNSSVMSDSWTTDCEAKILN